MGGWERQKAKAEKAHLFTKEGEFADMRAECQLLLCCARTKLSKDGTDRIVRLVDNGLDWDYVLETSKIQGLAPLLYYHLHQIDHHHQIPRSIMDRLHNTYHRNLARTMPLSYELNKILSVFQKKGILIVVLRGLALAQTIYENIALRVTADIDLLVQKKDLSLVAKTLLELGFRSPQSELSTKEYSAELCLTKRGAGGQRYLPGVCIDVHQDITSSIRLKRIIKTNTERLVTSAHPVRTKGTNMLAMAPEDLVLHLTLRHCFERLIRLCDIAEVIKAKQDKLNWQSLLQEGKENRITIIMYYTLLYARRLLEAPVPEDILKELKPNWCRKKLLDDLLSRSAYPVDSDGPSRCRKYFLQILMSDRLIDLLLVLWRVVFPPPEWLVYYYHHPRSRKAYLSHLSNLFTILLAGTGDILKVLGEK